MSVSELSAGQSTRGPREWFTSQAWMEELGTLDTPRPTPVLRVTFALGRAPPGTRIPLQTSADEPEPARSAIWQLVRFAL